MIESPVLDEAFEIVRGRAIRGTVADVLESRFGTIPESISGGLQAVDKSARLRELARVAGVCTNLEAFEAELRREP